MGRVPPIREVMVENPCRKTMFRREDRIKKVIGSNLAKDFFLVANLLKFTKIISSCSGIFYLKSV